MDLVMQHLFEVSLQQSQFSQEMAHSLHAAPGALDSSRWHLPLQPLSLTPPGMPSPSTPSFQWTMTLRHIWPCLRELPPERAGLSESGQMSWGHCSLGMPCLRRRLSNTTSSRAKSWPAVGYPLLKLLWTVEELQYYLTG